MDQGGDVEEVVEFVCSGWTGCQEMLDGLEKIRLEDCVDTGRDLEEAVNSKEISCVVQNTEHKLDRQLLERVHVDGALRQSPSVLSMPGTHIAPNVPFVA